MTPSEGNNQPPANPSALPVPRTEPAEVRALVSPADLDLAWPVAEGPSPLGPASPLSFPNLWRGLANRWLLGLTAGLLLLGTFASAAWYLLPAKYTAYALLRVAAAETDLLPDGRATAHAALAERYFENTQVALIKS